ncbi:MAG: MFS transporter [Chloroflexi bacterium]|nr:MFS transporter [Chloroflexota bacterium]MCI0578998.1 MFS transporter [Chloroflexota bacterium]MCI0644785.1 MFS transporter [Chloroflexota bacterium]MCI0731960.1 MFS transporter [Chloroflexota bacterium]
MPAHSALGEGSRKRGLLTLMTTSFLMHAGFFLIIPLLSVHYVDELGWAAAFIGVVLAVRQFMQQGLTVFGGALADRFGAKGLIMMGVLVRAASFVLMGFATTPPVLLLSGVLAALGGALFDAPQKAATAALAREEELPRYYAHLGVLMNVARTVGPLVGALLIQVDFRVVGLAAAAFFLVAFLVTLFGLPAVQVSTAKQRVTTGLKTALSDRAFVAFTALMMGYWFMWVQISISMPLLVKGLTGSNSSVALFFTVNSIMAIVLQIPALRLAGKFLLPLPMLIGGLVLMAFGLGSVAWAHSMAAVYLSVFFFSLGTVLATPNSQTVATVLASPMARGAYFGVFSLALALGGGLGHMAGGTLVDWAANLRQPALPWTVFALVGTLSAGGLVYFYNRNRPRLDASCVPVRV